jgi:hypothetical protein
MAIRNSPPPRNTVVLRKDAITSVVAPVDTVLHITDSSIPGRPIVLGKWQFFLEGDAKAFAIEQSQCHPAPQRFAVYDEMDAWQGSFQCGREMPAFQIVE